MLESNPAGWLARNVNAGAQPLLEREADDTDDDHRKRDRNLREDEREQRGETDGADRERRHGAAFSVRAQI